MLLDVKKQLSLKKSNLFLKNRSGNVILMVYYPLSVVFYVELLMIKMASIRNFEKFVWLWVQKSGFGQFQKMFKFCQSHHLSQASRFCEIQIWIKVSPFSYCCFQFTQFSHFSRKVGFIDMTTWQLTRIIFMVYGMDFRIFEVMYKWLRW